jgi:hypothetical protein
MSSYAERLATELRLAYEAHDRDALERGLRRMVSTMHYSGPVEDRQRQSDCSKGKDCTCGRTIQRETCMERTATKRPHGARDGDLCPDCGWTCNVCVCEAPAWRELGTFTKPVNSATFDGTLHCTKAACECTSWPQAKTCMHRRAA